MLGGGGNGFLLISDLLYGIRLFIYIWYKTHIKRLLHVQKIVINS